MLQRFDSFSSILFKHLFNPTQCWDWSVVNIFMYHLLIADLSIYSHVQAMVGLVTVEARLQSELLFALRAVMKFMT